MYFSGAEFFGIWRFGVINIDEIDTETTIGEIIRKTVIVLAMDTHTGIDYQMNIPIMELQEIIATVNDVYEERAAAIREANGHG